MLNMETVEAVEQYKYFVVSYLESTSSYHSKYRSSEGRSSKFIAVRLYDEDEVKNHIFGLELAEAIDNHYTSMTFLWYDHYIHTADAFSYDYYNPELPESWQKEIIERVNEELGRREAAKEAARLEEIRKAGIIKEQEEKKLLAQLKEKYDGKSV